MKSILILSALASVLALVPNNMIIDTDPDCVNLFAGQNIDVGEFCTSVSGSNLVMSYQLTNGWALSETHLWLGAGSLALMPQTKSGNPQPGRFPFTSAATGSRYDLSIPLTSLDAILVAANLPFCGSNFLVAAHAAVVSASGQSETAWSEGARMVSRGNWATYSTFKVTCTAPPPTVQEQVCSSETAFALGDKTFTEILGSPRWGWSNGPIRAGTTVQRNIYAGAGQNNVLAGTNIGSLLIEYVDASRVRVTFSINNLAVVLKTHVYLGYSQVTTTAPGQYTCLMNRATDCQRTFTDGTRSVRYEFDLSAQALKGSDIYVVAHADSRVCK